VPVTSFSATGKLPTVACFPQMHNEASTNFLSVHQVLRCNSSGSLAMFAAIRRASSRVSSLAAGCPLPDLPWNDLGARLFDVSCTR
jgi:hypothetical protein